MFQRTRRVGSRLDHGVVAWCGPGGWQGPAGLVCFWRVADGAVAANCVVTYRAEYKAAGCAGATDAWVQGKRLVRLRHGRVQARLRQKRIGATGTRLVCSAFTHGRTAVRATIGRSFTAFSSNGPLLPHQLACFTIL